MKNDFEDVDIQGGDHSDIDDEQDLMNSFGFSAQGALEQEIAMDVDMDDEENANGIEPQDLTADQQNQILPSQPSFPALSATEIVGRNEVRKIQVPSHRYSPLKREWLNIYTPIVTHMKLQIRMNTKARLVEIRTCEETEFANALQKAADFVKAFMLGFDVKDAIALLRLDDLYIESFEISDVKILQGDNMSRAIGRVSGKDGKTKFTIENSTRTRIVIADRYIHILGAFANIQIARGAICNLIIGSPPGKVYGRLRSASSRLNERM